MQPHFSRNCLPSPITDRFGALSEDSSHLVASGRLSPSPTIGRVRMILFRGHLPRIALLIVVFLYLSLWLFSSLHPKISQKARTAKLERQYPLVWKYIYSFQGSGGDCPLTYDIAWYIPPSWIEDARAPPAAILEAAQLVLNATSNRHLPYSKIPMVVHQTWKDTRIDTWSPIQLKSVEKWLGAILSADMAYFLWDDNGVAQLISELEPNWVQSFFSLPVHVEQSDVFRIMLCQHFGGTYADIDTEPLHPPPDWITPTDIIPWDDAETGTRYYSRKPVQAIFGVEADCPSDTDSHWRMGYVYPVQLTQWAFASASNHPALTEFLASLQTRLQEIALRHGGSLMSPLAQMELKSLDPLTFTGPAAVTRVIQKWLEKSAGLRWNAVSGLKDGGMSKQVDDVLILPITGFSPGRGVYGNMGSKPITHPSARLVHHGQGSWKNPSIKEEAGKICRTLFGLCKNWPKGYVVS